MFLAGALLLTGLFVVPGVLDAQRVDSSDDEDVTASVDVDAVATVSPRGPVTVRFPSSAAASSEREPVEATAATELSCAANTAHGVRVRPRSSSGAPLADRAGQLEWTADGGDSWAPLREGSARVVEEVEAGRHESCATVRFRWAPRDDGDPALAPDEVTVVFEAERLRGDRDDDGDDRQE